MLLIEFATMLQLTDSNVTTAQTTVFHYSYIKMSTY